MAKTEKGKEKVSRIKVKKKRWFAIFAPKFLGQKAIGESYLTEAESALGREMKINLRDLTGSIRDQNINVFLKIDKVEGGNLQTEVKGYVFMPFYTKKLARRGVGKIEDSFISETKEGKPVRLKPLVTTVFGVKNSVKTSIRKRMKELLEEEVSKLSFEGLILDLLRYRLQMELKKKLAKICPIREILLREVKIEEGGKAKAKGKEKKKGGERTAEEEKEEGEEKIEEKEEKKSEEKGELREGEEGSEELEEAEEEK